MPDNSPIQRYQVVLVSESDEDGGGWVAHIPELPGCMAAADTVEETMAMLEEAAESWMDAAETSGESIPDPIPKDHEYSGRFTLRIPRSLHRQLAVRAEAEGVSLNQYCIHLLSGRVPRKADIPHELLSYLRLIPRHRRARTTASFRIIDKQDWDDSEATSAGGDDYYGRSTIERLVT